MKALQRSALALLLALPLASHAVHICTDANGRSTFQDKACEAREALPQFAPVKAASVTEAGAIETMNRFTGAMGARDVVALQRLLARNFESRLTLQRSQPLLLDRAQFGQFFARALQAAKAYRIERSCSRDSAGDGTGTLALRCHYTDHLEVLARTVESGGDEFVRIVAENGELKLLEMSEAAAADAQRGKTTQAGR